MGISIVILTVLVQFIDVSKAKTILSRAVPGFLIIAFFVCILDRLLMGYKFRLILNAASIRISVRDIFRIYYVSSLQGLIVPFGVGPDILRFWRIKQYGASNADIIACILLERFLGMIATGSLILVSLCLLAARLSGLKAGGQMIDIFLMVSGFLFLILWLLFHEGVRNVALKRLRIQSVFSRIHMDNYYEAFSRFKDRRAVFVRFLSLSLLEQFFPVLVIYFSAQSLKLPIGFMDCLAVIPISTFAERLPLSFDGLGIREGANIFLFGMMHVDYSTSLILSLVAYLTFLFSLVPAAIWSFFEDVPPVLSKEPHVDSGRIP